MLHPFSSFSVFHRLSKDIFVFVTLGQVSSLFNRCHHISYIPHVYHVPSFSHSSIFLPDVYEMSEFSLTFQHVSCIFLFSFVILFLHASSSSTYFITISRPLISMFVVSFICHYLSMLILICVFDPSKPQLSSMTESPNVEPPVV